MVSIRLEAVCKFATSTRSMKAASVLIFPHPFPINKATRATRAVLYILEYAWVRSKNKNGVHRRHCRKLVTEYKRIVLELVPGNLRKRSAAQFWQSRWRAAASGLKPLGLPCAQKYCLEPNYVTASRRDYCSGNLWPLVQVCTFCVYRALETHIKKIWVLKREDRFSDYSF